MCAAPNFCDWNHVTLYVSHIDPPVFEGQVGGMAPRYKVHFQRIWRKSAEVSWPSVMTITQGTSEALKVDAVGRLRTPREKREAILSAYADRLPFCGEVRISRKHTRFERDIGDRTGVVETEQSHSGTFLDLHPTVPRKGTRCPWGRRINDAGIKFNGMWLE